MLRAHRQKADPKETRRWQFDLSMLNATIAGVVVVAISTAVSALMAVLTFEQLDVLRNQQKIMEAQQRPWLSIKLAPFERSVALKIEDRASFWYYLTVSNVGQAVGTEIQVDKELLVFGDGGYHPEITDRQSEICSRTSLLSRNQTNEIGYSLFPGEERKNFSISDLSATDVEKALKNSKTGRLWFVLVGCVTYKFYVTPDLHQTMFAFDLSRSIKPRAGKGRTEELDASEITDAFEPNTSIPGTLLHVERSFSGNHLAN